MHIILCNINRINPYGIGNTCTQKTMRYDNRMMWSKENLKALRKLKKMSQQKLADSSGLHRRSIQDIESGKLSPSVTKLKMLATALNEEIIIRPQQKPGSDALTSES
jgi:DNA-binding XRE family transcriptional regulator